MDQVQIYKKNIPNTIIDFLSVLLLLLFLSINNRSVFGNSPGPRTLRRAPASGAVPSASAGLHNTGGGAAGGIGLVDDAGTSLVSFVFGMFVLITFLLDFHYSFFNCSYNFLSVGFLHL